MRSRELEVPHRGAAAAGRVPGEARQLTARVLRLAVVHCTTIVPTIPLVKLDE
jgi:hypothetical protein